MVRIAYLDCFAGISGDMFLGALIGAGVEPEVFHNAVAAMNIGAAITIEKVDRSGIASTKVSVFEGRRLAEDSAGASRASATFPEQRRLEDHAHRMQTQTQHLHKPGHSGTHENEHTHEHEHTHRHGRSLTEIRRLIDASSLERTVKQTAIHAFEFLGASEAKIHNVPVDQIHFHEVGAVDAIVDIVAASAGIHALNVDRWVCSPVNVGGGMVDCAHGLFPVPAPATADLLRGFPTYSAHLEKELVTPTGAALLRVVFEVKGLNFGPQPAMRVEQIGYGAGSRNPPRFPNVLRLLVGDESAKATGEYEGLLAGQISANQGFDIVAVLETALDDLSPQVIAQVAEAALAKGALDVMLTPVIMKKGRPGTLVTLLCKPEESAIFKSLLLRETSTLGIRIREEKRVCLTREFATVSTSFGAIRIKVGKLAAQGAEAGEILNANPEFEDCRAAAAAHNVPLKQVHQAAVAAYLNSTKSVEQAHA